MTPEAALTKLYCLLATGLAAPEVRQRVQENLAGELIVDPAQQLASLGLAAAADPGRESDDPET